MLLCKGKVPFPGINTPGAESSGVYNNSDFFPSIFFSIAINGVHV